MEPKSNFKLFCYGLLNVLLLLALIRLLFSFGGKMFFIEFIGLIGLLILALAGFAGYTKSWGERVLFFVFLLYLLNLIFVWYFDGTISVAILILSVIGFVMAASSPGRCSCKTNQTRIVDFESKKQTKTGKKEESAEEPHSQVFEAEEPAAERTKPEARPETRPAAKPISLKTEFVPGKFLASKKGNQYHLPRCDWAKKIAKSNRIWLKNKEEAWEKGYRAHDCVK